MADDPDAVTFGVHLLFCTKNLERIGDHTTNIAEAVYYMVKGQALLGERPQADLTALTTTHSRNPVRESTPVPVGNEPFDQRVEGAATAK
jgi:phosphate transport system protein